MQLKDSKSMNGLESTDDEGVPLSPSLLCSDVFRENALTAEFNLFTKQKILGVYLVPKCRVSSEWMGVFFIRQGLYQGAILRFLLRIPEEFPDTTKCPQVLFEHAVYHPLISSETGMLDISRAFHSWRKGVHHIYQVLLYMQRVFYRIDLSNPVNKQAAETYEENPEQFRMNVAESVRRSREAVYDPPESADPHAIRFTPWDQSVHEPIRQKIFHRLRQFPFREELNRQGSLALAF